MLSISMFCYLHASSQRDTNEYEMGWPFEESPVFNGDLKAFVQKNICYPDSALLDSIEGLVLIEYLVDTSGNTVDHMIVRGVRDDLNKEAIRVARLIKYDSPAKLKDKPIPFYFTMPIEFKLHHQERLLQKNGCKK